MLFRSEVQLDLADVGMGGIPNPSHADAAGDAVVEHQRHRRDILNLVVDIHLVEVGCRAGEDLPDPRTAQQMDVSKG